MEVASITGHTTLNVLRRYLTGTGARFDVAELSAADRFELPFGVISTLGFVCRDAAADLRRQFRLGAVDQRARLSSGDLNDYLSKVPAGNLISEGFRQLVHGEA
jgi:hypothetical protein